MKQKTCCFTGHRDIPLGDYQLIFDKTEETVERLIKKGYLSYFENYILRGRSFRNHRIKCGCSWRFDKS